MENSVFFQVFLSPIVLLAIFGVICAIVVLATQGRRGTDTRENEVELDGRPVREEGPVSSWVGAMLVILIIAVLAAIAIPSFVKSRNTSSQNACINNLRCIDSGKEQWAMAENKVTGAPVVTNQVNMYIKGNTIPLCPAGGSYSYNAIGSDPTCTVTAPTTHSFSGY